MNEIAVYYRLADPDTIAAIRDCYSDPKRVMMAVAETAYIYEHNELPEWGVIVERFEIINGHYLFIHRDMTAAQ